MLCDKPWISKKIVPVPELFAHFINKRALDYLVTLVKTHKKISYRIEFLEPHKKFIMFSIHPPHPQKHQRERERESFARVHDQDASNLITVSSRNLNKY